MKKIISLITLLIFIPQTRSYACNCIPINKVSVLEQRVVISDVFIKGKIIAIDTDTIPYKTIKVTYEVLKTFKGSKNETKKMSIYYDAFTSCGVLETNFKIGQVKLITARTVEDNSKKGTLLEANYCDLSKNISDYDSNLLQKYLLSFKNEQ